MPPRRRESANRGFVFPRSASVRWSDTEQLYAYAEIILIYSVVIVSLRKTKAKTPFFFFFLEMARVFVILRQPVVGRLVLLCGVS